MMISFRTIFLTVLALTLASGAAATYLAGSGRREARNRVAERLAQIALIGAGAIMMLLSEGMVE